MGLAGLFEFSGANPHRSPQRERRQRNVVKPRPRSEAVGRGSGVLISADGYLVTNFTLSATMNTEVKTADGKVYDNERLGRGHGCRH